MTEQFVEKNWTKQFVNNIIINWTGQGTGDGYGV